MICKTVFHQRSECYCIYKYRKFDNDYKKHFFHRVKDFDAIKGILEDGIIAFSCKEEIFMGKRGKESIASSLLSK